MFNSESQNITKLNINKKYNMKHYFVQNKIIVDSVDLVVFFENDKETTKIKDLKRYTEKQKKITRY